MVNDNGPASSRKEDENTGSVPSDPRVTLSAEEQLLAAYREACASVRLVSQEIYSRFAAMLVANTIVITMVGWVVSRDSDAARRIALTLPVAGIVICWLWFFFTNHGSYWHRVFRSNAIALERYFHEEFRVMSRTDLSLKQNVPPLVRWATFSQVAFALIFLFASVHEAFLWVLGASRWWLFVGTAFYVLLTLALVCASARKAPGVCLRSVTRDTSHIPK